ncbi:MAG: TrpR YerC/YecD [Clostridiales bacterium GWF2_38_85]|nr:MAG: TrpR YerC/YecD [Clostridiales bacterium GWF2_38_85]HBL84622.1 hypothetical protein [Clostridiales bacterium]
MNDKLKTEQVTRLCEAFALLRTDDECYRFLTDLCTESELQEMSKRLDAAQKLREGIIYNEIAALTGLSTATITRVNRSLRYGNDGYHMVLDRLSAKS